MMRPHCAARCENLPEPENWTRRCNMSGESDGCGPHVGITKDDHAEGALRSFSVAHLGNAHVRPAPI